MHFGQGNSTITATILLCLFWLIKLVTTQSETFGVLTHLSGPSGEFTSPGYPATNQAGLFSWNITVNKDHQILLQFLDFQLFEFGPPCVLDSFELYDGPFGEGPEIGRWCWDSFDELTTTTYTSSGNVFFIRYRAAGGFSRKGFSANYSSMEIEVPTTSSVYVTQPSTSEEVANVITTQIQAVSVISTSNNIASTISTIRVEDTSPGTSTTSDLSIGIGVPSSNTVYVTQATSPATVPNVTATSTQAVPKETTTTTTAEDMQTTTHSLLAIVSNPLFLIAGSGMIFLIIFFCCLAWYCCCFRRREKKKIKDSKKSTDAELQLFTSVAPIESSEYSAPRNSSPEDPLNSSMQNGEGNNGNSSLSQTVGSATPLKNKTHELKNGKHPTKQNKGKKNKVKSREDFDQNNAHGMERDSTQFEINVAYQSCDFEKENIMTTEPINNEYTYVENTNISTDNLKTSHGVKGEDVTYSLPDGEEVESNELVPNIAYQSFDSTDIQAEGADSVDMITNVAYKSWDTEEEEVGQSDGAYYYVDEKGTGDGENQTDIVYESVQTGKT